MMRARAHGSISAIREKISGIDGREGSAVSLPRVIKCVQAHGHVMQITWVTPAGLGLGFLHVRTYGIEFKARLSSSS
jgi:hypothetical protein